MKPIDKVNKIIEWMNRNELTEIFKADENAKNIVSIYTNQMRKI